MKKAKRNKLCIHTVTTKPWSIEIALGEYAKHGVAGITVWRDALAGRKIKTVAEMIKDVGMEVVSLCRGGFFPSVDPQKRREAVEDNLRAIDEAAELDAPLIVLVCGADPQQSLEESRKQILDGIGEIAAAASKVGIKLAIEPLHPMYADSRSAINTIGGAIYACDELGLDNVGIAVDVYHLWWDPDLEVGIRRAGEAGKLFAFHVCDWRTPTEDLLLDRGLMGEGCIPIREIRSWMEEAGFEGFNEVEIFSKRYWSTDQSRFLEMIIEAYDRFV